MDAITDNMLVFVDDARSNFVHEARKEITGESHSKWALLLTAFVLGAAVATILIALRLRRDVDKIHESDVDAALSERGNGLESR